LVNAENKEEIAVVHEWAGGDKHTWEPPKGQMEWKEFRDSHIRANSRITIEKLLPFMREGALREMSEEAKILPRDIRNLRLLPMTYAEARPSAKGTKGAQFQYQFWTAELDPRAMHEAQKRMKKLVDNPILAAKLPSDVREKDKVMWWKPSDGWSYIRGAFSKKMTAMFYKEREKHGV